MPNFDFWLDASPEMKPQDERESAATMALIQLLKTDPWAVDTVAQVNHFSPALVRKLRENFQKFQQEQARAAQAQVAAQDQARAQVPQGDGGGQEEQASRTVERLLASLTPQSAQQG